MKINRAYKYELDPNDKQVTHFMKACGIARLAYNWGLARKIEHYKTTGKSLSAYDLHKEINILKKTEFGFMYEVSKSAPQESLRDLDKAYLGFFRRMKIRKSNKDRLGFPKFKKKNRSKDSFRLNMKIRYGLGFVMIPNLGRVRIKNRETTPIGFKLNSTTISRNGNKWFVSFQGEVEIPDPINNKEGEAIGIDLGISRLATCSNGLTFDNPKHLKNNLKRLRRSSRSLSRKVTKSSNWIKNKEKLRRLHYKISCLRSDSIHKITSSLAKTKPRAIVIEDLNIKGMMKNKRLSRSIADSGFHEFRRQLEYKCKWSGIELIVADRFYPSSKTCSGCGHKKYELSLSERMFTCDECGLKIDRDMNAALNLASLAMITVSSTGFEACGDSVRPVSDIVLTRAGSVKQEENAIGLSD